MGYIDGRDLAPLSRRSIWTSSSDEADVKKDALYTFLRENEVEYDDGHGQYTFWLFGTKYRSTYKLAVYFSPDLPSSKREWTARGNSSRKRPRPRRDEDRRDERSDEDDTFVQQHRPVRCDGGTETILARLARLEAEVVRKDAEIARLKSRPAQVPRPVSDSDRLDSGSQTRTSTPRSSPPPENNPGLFVYAPPPRAINPFVQQIHRQARSLEALRLGTVDDSVTLEDVEEVFDRRIGHDGEFVCTLRDKCNFGPGVVLDAFNHVGVTFATAMEQSGKTHLMVALVALASTMKRPCVVLAGVPHATTCELSDKMKDPLEYLGIRTRFISNAEQQWTKFLSDPDEVRDFLSGHLVVVTPAYAMGRCTFLERLDARDVLVLVDESDVLFARDEWAVGSKEEVVGDLLSEISAEGARASGAVMISATHIGDLHIWNTVLRDVSVKHIKVDLDLLRDRGFTTHHEMELINTVDLGDAVKEKQHGLTTLGFRHLMKDFKECAGTRKLMLVASCPRVNAGDSTLFTQADLLMRYDPEAIVVVHYSGNCFFKPNYGDATCTWTPMTVINPLGLTNRERKPAKVKTIGLALRLLQLRYCSCSYRPAGADPGAPGTSAAAEAAATTVVDRRFIVVGYNALARSTSPRTDDMVPTHMFALMGKGRHSADVRQTLMRPAGHNTGVRAKNGHGDVKVVTTEADWELVSVIYEFQEMIQDEMARNPSFNFETFRDYSIGYASVIGSGRKHARPSIVLKNEWAVKATPQEKAEHKAWRDETRRMRLESMPSVSDILSVTGETKIVTTADHGMSSDGVVVEEDEEEEEEDAQGANRVAGEDLPLERRDVDRSVKKHNSDRGRLSGVPEKVILTMAARGPITESLAEFGKAAGIHNLTSGKYKALHVLRSRGLITSVGEHPLRMTTSGCRYIIDTCGESALSEYYRELL